MAEIPVYFFTGFMDSGKTTLIQETLFENGFAEDDDHILIIACEDGDVEYDTEKLKTINASVATIDTEAEFNTEHLQEIADQYRPDAVFIEYNGTWGVGEVYEMELPKNWVIVQSLATVDATTFEMYMANMRAMMMEQFFLARLSRCIKKYLTDNMRYFDDYFKDNMAFINVMKNMSVDCDCCSVAEDPCMNDIGILASNNSITMSIILISVSICLLVFAI